MARRATVGILVALTAFCGVLLTAANRWGAVESVPCRDTVTTTIAICAAPQSPWWALLLGAALPAAVVFALGLTWLRR
jgi:ABC-type branched-subunit amino acid transport system permease subunit